MKTIKDFNQKSNGMAEGDKDIIMKQVRGEFCRIRTRKAAGPDKVCPRLLKTCC